MDHKLILSLFDSDSESSSDFWSDGSDNTSTASSDTELQAILNAVDEPSEKRARVYDFLEDTVKLYSNKEFKKHFRIERELFAVLSERMQNSESFKSLRMDSRLNTVEKHLAIFLWFAGHEGVKYRNIADQFNISLWLVDQMVDRTSNFLSGLHKEVIAWPNDARKGETAAYFKEKRLLPAGIGAIDVTHISIDPNGKKEYLDSKGKHSLNLQGICDHNRRFIDICIGLPGSYHESQVLENSPVFAKLTSLCGDYYILGGSAYPCYKHLLTPYRDNGHLTRSQLLFNQKINSCNMKIKNAFRILKERFPQLHHCRIRNIKKLNHFVRGCCVLHNLADPNDFNAGEIVIIPEHQQIVSGLRDSALGIRFRDIVCSKVVR